jgi:hypothetical protein
MNNNTVKLAKKSNIQNALGLQGALSGIMYNRQKDRLGGKTKMRPVEFSMKSLSEIITKVKAGEVVLHRTQRAPNINAEFAENIWRSLQDSCIFGEITVMWEMRGSKFIWHVIDGGGRFAAILLIVSNRCNLSSDPKFPKQCLKNPMFDLSHFDKDFECPFLRDILGPETSPFPLIDGDIRPTFPEHRPDGTSKECYDEKAFDALPAKDTKNRFVKQNLVQILLDTQIPVRAYTELSDHQALHLMFLSDFTKTACTKEDAYRNWLPKEGVLGDSQYWSACRDIDVILRNVCRTVKSSEFFKLASRVMNISLRFPGLFDVKNEEDDVKQMMAPIAQMNKIDNTCSALKIMSARDAFTFVAKVVRDLERISPRFSKGQDLGETVTEIIRFPLIEFCAHLAQVICPVDCDTENSPKLKTADATKLAGNALTLFVDHFVKTPEKLTSVEKKDPVKVAEHTSTMKESKFFKAAFKSSTKNCAELYENRAMMYGVCVNKAAIASGLDADSLSILLESQYPDKSCEKSDLVNFFKSRAQICPSEDTGVSENEDRNEDGCNTAAVVDDEDMDEGEYVDGTDDDEDEDEDAYGKVTGTKRSSALETDTSVKKHKPSPPADGDGEDSDLGTDTDEDFDDFAQTDQ